MRNITYLIIIVIIVFPVYGQADSERTYSLSISPQTGFIYGQSLELVYQNPSINNNEFLSELIWDIKPLFYAGLQLELSRKDLMQKTGFFSVLSFKAGIPADTGYMEDRDWMSNENTALTHFSKHSNNTQQFFQADISFGASIPVKSLFYIKPFLSGSWMHFSFKGTNGYGQYARSKSTNNRTDRYEPYYPISENPVTYLYSGTVITYKQDWLLLALGFTAGTKVLYPFTIDFSFRISPLTYCIALDDHYLQGKVFKTWKDYSVFGLYIEPGLAVSFSLKRIDFSLDFNYRHIGKTRGALYTIENGKAYLSPLNDGGAGISFIDLRFLLKIKIGHL